MLKCLKAGDIETPDLETSALSFIIKTDSNYKKQCYVGKTEIEEGRRLIRINLNQSSLTLIVTRCFIINLIHSILTYKK